MKVKSMGKGIKIATTDVRTARVNEKVVDSTLPGSWKIAKHFTLKTAISRPSGDPVHTQTMSEAHGLGYTPAFMAMVESDFGLNGMVLYNAPSFSQNVSLKVAVDSKNVYCTVVCGLTGTFQFNFRVAVLGEKLE
jgi:hypothetical protein